MKRSLFLYKRSVGSTENGMRRILKRPLPLDKYYRQAVDSGVYLGNEEEEEALTERQHETRVRQRKYPFEYEVLQLYPPITIPPRMPKKYERGRERLHRLHDNSQSSIRRRLMKKYLKNKVGAPYYASSNDDDISSNEYYRKLLGIPPPTTSSSMGQKSSILNKAYAVAVKQEELMRRSNNSMSEEESMGIVDQLLQQAQEEETARSRKVQTRVKQWKEKQQEQEAAAAAAPEDDVLPENKKMTLPPGFNDDEDEEDEVDWDSIPSILHSKPRTIQGIALWSRKLQAVPYLEWTIGAATALDHFIARSILDLTEETWDAILEGTDPSLKSVGRDIVLVRRTLFPETNFDAMEEEEEEEEYGEINDEEGNTFEEDKSIEELLANLGGFEVEAKEEEQKRTMQNMESDIEDSIQHQAEELRSELQNWRNRHWEENPYNEWSPRIQKEFQQWLRMYVEVLHPEEFEEGNVDYRKARKALLSVPPITEEESNTFWDSIQDEASARSFLTEVQKQQEARSFLTEVQKQLEEGKGSELSTRDTVLFHKFQTFSTVLSFDDQVSKLVHLSTLRPIYDEYDSNQPQTRLSFLERHADKLLQGLELEHFIPAEDGPITGQNLIDWGYATSNDAETNKDNTLMLVAPNDKFVLQKLPYDYNAESKRNMMVAWNIHKASRARYEEFLFGKGKLGLRYSDKVVERDDED